MASDRESTLRDAHWTCADFFRQYLYSLAISKHIKQIVAERDKGNLHLLYISNNFADMAVLDWCHLFGGRNDPLHFRQVMPDPDDFKTTMLAEIDQTEEDFEIYWEHIKEYRDNMVAHRNPSADPIYPKLGPAAHMIAIYNRFIIPELKAYPNPSYKYLHDDLLKYAKSREEKFEAQMSVLCKDNSN